MHNGYLGIRLGSIRSHGDEILSEQYRWSLGHAGNVQLLYLSK